MDEILIIGGGAAGLMTALELLERNYSVVILEARDRVGGRIQTIRDKKFEKPVERSAEFIHGELPVMMELIKKANLDYQPVKGKMYRVENGQWERQTEFAEGWRDLIEKMNDLTDDLVFSDFLKKNFSQEKYRELRETATRFAEGFDVADVTKISTLALRAEWMEEDDKQYRIPGGFDQLMNWMADECSRKGGGILTEQRISSVQWKKNMVRVTTDNNISFLANKIIVTVSLGVLQSDPPLINFGPNLGDHFAAAKQIGFGNVVKIMLQFKKPFWQEKEKGIGFIFSREKIPTWWTNSLNENLLTGWAGGGQAKRIDSSTDAELLDLALESLSKIFKMNIDELGLLLTAATVTNWKNDPLARGAYSYNMPLSVAAKEILRTPVDNTIFFAGEGLYEGSSPGTVEAALVSGRIAAMQLMQG